MKLNSRSRFIAIAITVVITVIAFSLFCAANLTRITTAPGVQVKPLEMLAEDPEPASIVETAAEIESVTDTIWAAHYYAFEKDGSYIYEEDNKDENKKGVREKNDKSTVENDDTRTPLSVQYKGRQNGRTTLTFQYPQSRRHGTVVCDAECQFVDVKLFDDQTLIRHSSIRITNDQLIFGMVHDALNGKLSEKHL